jgi:hypothetical protein
MSSNVTPFVGSGRTPRVGMLATLRNRRGVISAVESFSNSKSSALLHLVTIEFVSRGSSHGNPSE